MNVALISFFRQLAATRTVLAALLLLTLAGCKCGDGLVRGFGDRFDFALIGDIPYSPAAVSNEFPRLLADLNSRRLAFVVHDGDIKSGSTPCTDEVFLERRAQFAESRHPFIYIFGDNEWTDCGRVQPATDPVERLEKLRALFTEGHQTLGRRTLRLVRQSDLLPSSPYRENIRWQFGKVGFVGCNIPGSGNNYGKPEFTERNAANLAWLKDSFADARQNDLKALMIIIQANPLFDASPTNRARLGFNDFLATLERETVQFAKPVVLVHGDTHYFRIDKPMLGHASGRRVENFTRVETFGNPDAHWLRVTVNYRDPNIFTFRPVIVEANRVNHRH